MKKIGLVLGAGGGKGFAHLGVLKVLQENDIMPDYVIGSSIGALVGGFFCKFKDYKKVEEVLFNFDWKELSSLLCLKRKGGLLGGEKLRRYLDLFLKGSTFENTEIPFEAVATNLFNAQPFYFNKGSLAEGIQASIAFPMFIQPLRKKDNIFWDGGLSDPLPVKRAKEKAEIVLAVNLERYPEIYNLQKMNSHQTILRAIKSLQYHLANQHAKEAEVLLEPDFKREGDVLSITNFLKKDKRKEIMEKGVKITKQNLEIIKRWKR